MNLQECKYQIASENGLNLDRSRDSDTFNSSEYYSELVAKLYACEKVKEALKLVVEEVDSNISTTDGHESILRICKSAIISIETEIVNQINKEG